MSRRIRGWAVSAVLAAILSVSAPAIAGRGCEPAAPTVQELKKTAALATRTQAALETGGQQLYIIGRIGQNLTEYRLTYSHVAFVLKNTDGPGWTVYHELNECGTASSGVYAEGLLEFFTDLYQHEAAIVYLPADLQERLATRLRTNPKTFHEPSYSVVAYPFSTKHQNSNQWLAETLAAGMSTDIELTTRAQAQGWLKAAGFEPTELAIGPMTRLGGRVFKAQVYFNDHPSELRWSSRIQTTTAESLFKFVQRRYPADYKLETVELF